MAASQNRRCAGCIDVVPKLYGRALIPQTVYDELAEPSAPDVVRAWRRGRPVWLEVRIPARSANFTAVDIEPGERDAILLAEEPGADRLIIDDQEGRHEAERRGLPVSGTLGVLRDAGMLGFLDLEDAIRRPQSRNFRVAPELLSKLLSESS